MERIRLKLQRIHDTGHNLHAVKVGDVSIVVIDCSISQPDAGGKPAMNLPGPR